MCLWVLAGVSWVIFHMKGAQPSEFNSLTGYQCIRHFMKNKSATAVASVLASPASIFNLSISVSLFMEGLLWGMMIMESEDKAIKCQHVLNVMK